MNRLEKYFRPVDMTVGRPWEDILIFTIPMLIGNIAQQLYSTVDSIVVGRYVGDNALAAVGSAAPILNLLIVLFVGVSVGASIMVSQYLGARNREGLSKAIGSAVVLTAMAALIVMVFATLLARPLLELLHTPETIIDWCTSYLRILFVGCAGSAFYNILSGILRGLGDSVSALIYLVVASVLNIFLDIFFVANLKLGVSGVALATLIAQTVSAFLCVRRLAKMRDLFDFKWKYIRWFPPQATGIIRLGIPSGLTQAIMSMSMLVVQSLTNSFGELFIAANVIVMRVDGFAMLPNFSFGTAMTTYAGQNVGAGDYDRVSKGARQGLFMAVGSSAAIVGLILLFGKNLMHIFTDTQELVDLSYRMMCILAAGYVAVAVTQTLSGVMRGAGDTMTPMWISMVTTILIRVPLAYGLVYLTRTPELPRGNRTMIFVSLLTSWILGAVITSFFYLRGRWKTKAIKG